MTEQVYLILVGIDNMQFFGEPPFLECSNRGDKRFSAFNAYIGSGILSESIESRFQRAKVIEDAWGNLETGLHWKEAKGKTPVAFVFNGKKWPVSLLKEFYYMLWWVYLKGNPELIKVIEQYNGFSDFFGQEGHCCQAEAIWLFRQGKEPFRFKVE